ncbi:serine/threonine protein phosphatase 2A 57 kDa regulatory subunit B' kappa isoform-like [Zingiber officinale]|uniref:serine/threonine protein phosphatase 2A 57 kDa regulatory subunit B' kappa isoform-like n=1 Tax=Zingiber officinale TaxID=94328 RepID=UPI001C4D8E1C|nr:serine/threonine protein phosphatase 2A 57 kDa regulatory subunit B' kappa isoform-like [Zingiber officinale]XP_042392628.1 serine/threonine protein phosphatase 2A 57 kDa regulatory subunit B' kappa isoform-like [Zingiber officinale]XP_042392629.1 serine/threonine protein phosphatase 2A 57 kDa regulatory subunit B' kappa isoform-like [Zingiber officinale]XP_042392630.1 serine/threonine protein phosphatase 2A 57 kDa regulatory subunit B' kappa isoform-like [Zingiber officinale]
MWKQFLSRLPRKSSKSDASPRSSHGQSGSDVTTSANGNPIQRTSSGNVVASRSTTVKRTASSIFPSSVVTSIDPLLLFNDVSDTEKQNLFVSKLNLCCVVFDFSDPNKNSAEKDKKRQALLDSIDYVDSEGSCFTEPIISSSCKMFASNLFRAFPPNTRSSSGGGETEEQEPTFEPAWSHLQLVYDLFLKFLESSSLDAKIAKKYVHHSFIVRLLHLFDSEDPRERDCLKAILHRIYGKFMVHRPFIRKAVSNIFYQFVFETNRHNGIAELLEVFGSVISGFALPLKEEHKLFLWRVLIPLHKPKGLGVYHQQLIYCVTQFVEKEPKLIIAVINGLLRYWPVTNSQKEIMFLSELEEILEATNEVDIQKCMLPLFQRIGYCINSPHFQVAERALLMWNNDRVISLVSQNWQSVMPLILPALERNIRSHWNQAVLNLTQNIKKLLYEMDEELFLACKKKFEEEEVKQDLMEKRRMTWEHLESTAAFQPATRNVAVQVRPVISPPVVAALS